MTTIVVSYRHATPHLTPPEKPDGRSHYEFLEKTGALSSTLRPAMDAVLPTNYPSNPRTTPSKKDGIMSEKNAELLLKQGFILKPSQLKGLDGMDDRDVLWMVKDVKSGEILGPIFGSYVQEKPVSSKHFRLRSAEKQGNELFLGAETSNPFACVQTLNVIHTHAHAHKQFWF